LSSGRAGRRQSKTLHKSPQLSSETIIIMTSERSSPPSYFVTSILAGITPGILTNNFVNSAEATDVTSQPWKLCSEVDFSDPPGLHVANCYMVPSSSDNSTADVSNIEYIQFNITGIEYPSFMNSTSPSNSQGRDPIERRASRFSSTNSRPRTGKWLSPPA
jgi:hypothetical protein